MKRRSLNIFTISIGNKYQIKHKFTAYDVTQFANISTDQNPHHIDQLYAQNSIFGQRIVHGILSASLFSSIMGNQFQAIYLSQNLNFLAPVYLDEEVLATVTIIDIQNKRNDKKILTLETILQKIEQNKIAIQGEAKILL